MMLVLRVFPALIFPFLLYLLLLAGGPGALASGHGPLFHITMMSGAVVAINAADIVALAIVACLSLDLGSASNTGTTAIVHLCVDAVLAVIYLVLFLLFSAFATAVFLALTAAALLEFMIGGWIMVVSARRDVAYGAGA
ncbi:MAG: hypothetical protein JSS00_05075 [Proteobacteria bacterium]|nr:hypothetical protein [Pseudomonadota bacterium]